MWSTAQRLKKIKDLMLSLIESMDQLDMAVIVGVVMC